MKKIGTTTLLWILFKAAHAQSSSAENTDIMHVNGKIYVVVAVVLIILCGLFFYVYKLDKKITKLENND